MYIDPNINSAGRFDTSIISTEIIGMDFVLDPDPGELQTTDTLQIFLNELDLLIDVEKIDRALHTRSINAERYKTFIETSLKNNSIAAPFFQYTIEIKVAQGTRRDIMIIDIVITNWLGHKEDFTPIHKQFII